MVAQCSFTELIEQTLAGELPLSQAPRLFEAQGTDLTLLMHHASALRQTGKGSIVSYSRKVFIPLTTLCRDDCGYCTFKKDPGQPGAGFLTPEEVLQIAHQGKAQGCKEALFSLGDKPELRFPQARKALENLGYDSTMAYLVAMSQLVLQETGLLPHANPGIMNRADLAQLKTCSPSVGLMLENTSPRMQAKGMPHEHAPDKAPKARLASLRFAGEHKIPFTTGMLIGIGETPKERAETVWALRDLHQRHGHIQEVIVQNFRAKPGIPMQNHPHASLKTLLATLAATRLILGPSMNIQAPPNLSGEAWPFLLLAGINDWGGISPVTVDHINPEAPWPHLENLAQLSAEMGYSLEERLSVYPEYLRQPAFVSAELSPYIASLSTATGYAR